VRILVVEDDKKTAAFIAKAFKAEGFAVDCLRNGDDALAAVQTTPFDAVVLDIMILGRDGLSVLKQMRAKGIHTPVLLLSARGEVNERVEGLNAGAEDYLAKPFALEELGGSIHISLRKNAGTAELRVTNSGEPIGQEMGARIFDRFVRGENAAGKVEGCGLGLTIARWIVQAHGGGIELSSTTDRETTAFVRLPIGPASPTPVAKSLAAV
jgi:DNA-binding response OmpR family regulator